MKYTEEIIAHVGMSSYKSSSTSVDTKAKLNGYSGNLYHEPSNIVALLEHCNT